MNADQLTVLFNECFSARYNVELKGGASEPLYEPESEQGLACIWFREDFASSALHEIAHWLIAGAERRRLPDYGYWYEGDRDAETQRRFEAAELKPQAMEWILSESAGVDFRVSCDNFDESTLSLDAFRQSVQREAWRWLKKGLPDRAALFQSALSKTSGCAAALRCETYEVLPR